MDLKKQLVDRDSFLGTTIRSLPTLIVLTGLVTFFESMGWLDGLQNYALDRVLQMNWSRQSNRVVLITIRDQDYENPEFFNGKSPLDPQKIQDAVDLIAKAGPAVIGIDLETLDPRYAGTAETLHGIRTVWARPATVAREKSELPNSLTSFWHHAAMLVVPKGFLAGKYTQQTNDEELTTIPPSGVSIMPGDADHVVRRYLRHFRVEEDGVGRSKIDSFPWAIVKQYCEYCLEHADQPRCIGRERAQRILDHAKTSEGHGSGQAFNFSQNPERFRRIGFADFVTQNRQGLWPKTGSPLEGRIVLIGGEFAQSRDVHFTPVGERYGVEMVGEAIDGEIEGHFISHLATWLAVALDLAAGLALVVAHWWLHRPWTVLATASMIFVLSIFCSIVAFHTAAYWFNFTAVLLGVWIHLLWDSSQARRRDRRELEEYRRRYGPLTAVESH